MTDKETVVVGCRMPNGLRLHVTRRRAQPVAALLDAGMAGLANFEDLGFIDLGGTSTASGAVRPEAFTTVDKEMFDAWMAENTESSLVTSGMVFASQPAQAEDPVLEPAEEPAEADTKKSGFARVAPKLPPQE